MCSKSVEDCLNSIERNRKVSSVRAKEKGRENKKREAEWDER